MSAAPSDRAGAGGHVLVLVENVALGIDIRVRKQVRDLLEAGHRVTVVTRSDPENAAFRELPGLTVLEYPSPREPAGPAGYLREYGVSFVHAAVLALRTRRRGPVDVLQICQPPDIYFPLAHLLRRLGARVLLDQRDLMPELFAARYGGSRPAVAAVLHWFERRSVRAADRVLGVNEYLRDRLAAAGTDRGRVGVVYNGPVLARVQGRRPDPRLRGDRAHLCCWIGKMGRQDRVDLLLDVVAHVVHRLGRTDCRFAVLGDGECLDDLRARARELGVAEWVDLPGWRPEDEVFTYLATADVGVDTSLQAEVSPVKVLEYMAAGLPVVAHDLPETRAVGRDAAVLVRPGAVEEFARELVGLLDDPARREALGRAGRRRMEEELGWERQREVYLAVVDELVRGVGQTPSAVRSDAT